MTPEAALRIAIEVLAAHPELLERWLEPRSASGKRLRFDEEVVS